MADYYKINGVDILSYIAPDGLQIEENDVESPDAGRTLDGTMQRGIVARNRRKRNSCRIFSDCSSVGFR